MIAKYRVQVNPLRLRGCRFSEPHLVFDDQVEVADDINTNRNTIHYSRTKPSADSKFSQSTMIHNQADHIVQHNDRPSSCKDPSRPASLSRRCNWTRCKHVVLRKYVG